MENLVLTSLSWITMKEEIKAIVYSTIKAFNLEEIQEKLLSSKEARKLFTPAIAHNTLISLQKSGALNEYRVGSNVFYKYSEVVASLKSFKRHERRATQ